jgi:hypothetical protein
MTCFMGLKRLGMIGRLVGKRVSSIHTLLCKQMVIVAVIIHLESQLINTLR